MNTTTIRIARHTLLDAGFCDEPGTTDQNDYMVEAVKTELDEAGIPTTVHMNSVEMEITVDNTQLADAAATISHYLA